MKEREKGEQNDSEKLTHDSPPVKGPQRPPHSVRNRMRFLSRSLDRELYSITQTFIACRKVFFFRKNVILKYNFVHKVSDFQLLII